MSRLLKQFIFGLLYLAILGAIGFGIWRIFIYQPPTCFDNIQNQNEVGIDCGGSCIDCELKYVKELKVVDLAVFQVDSKASAVFKIENPNPNYGADSFRYKIKLYDKNNAQVGETNGKSFIYAGETKYLSEFNINVGTDNATSAEISFSEINWKSSDVWEEPGLEIGKIDVQKDQGVFVITGSIKNPSNYIISQAVVNIILISNSGRQVGATKTELDNMKVFENRDFRVFAKVGPELESEVNAAATLIFVDAKK